jgi:hypothetical protein
MAHMFTVGQAVTLAPRVLRSAVEGDYEVVRLLPVLPDGPQYRIKSAKEKHERVAHESELSPSWAPESIFR